MLSSAWAPVLRSDSGHFPVSTLSILYLCNLRLELFRFHTLTSLVIADTGAKEVRLSVVHEQTSKQKTQTVHCQPAGAVFVNIEGEYVAHH